VLLCESVLLLLANLAEVRRVALALHYLLRWSVVVALIQTQVLRRLISGFTTIYDDSIEGILKRLEIRHVRSGYEHREWTTIRFYEHKSATRDKDLAFRAVLVPEGEANVELVAT
jgi:hypothetical protein